MPGAAVVLALCPNGYGARRRAGSEMARAMSLLTELDHVGIAVQDLAAEVDRYRRLFDAEPAHREVVASQGVEEVLFAVGTSYVQLLRPLGPETPVGRHLERRGPGLHHVAYRVAEISAAIERLREEGVMLIDQQPRAGSRGTTIAFVHPKAMGGVLVELVQPASSSGSDRPV